MVKKSIILFFFSIILLSCQIRNEDVAFRTEYYEKINAIERYYHFTNTGELTVDEQWIRKADTFYMYETYFKFLTDCDFHYIQVEGLPIYLTSDEMFKDIKYLKLWYDNNKFSMTKKEADSIVLSKNTHKAINSQSTSTTVFSRNRPIP